MPTFNAEEFIEDIDQLKTTEAIDEAFSDVFALPTAERKAAADALEKAYWSETEEDFANDIRERGFSIVKETVREDFYDAVKDCFEAGQVISREEAIEVAQLSAQVFFNIRELKGDDASPALKAYVAAAAKLTDEEYNDEYCFIKPMEATIDAVAKSEGLLKVNPLRKDPIKLPDEISSALSSLKRRPSHPGM